MHMSDALITPLVGGTTYAASTGLIGYSVKSIRTETFEERLPLMGVMGAFIFAAQMINFAIPGTGSSGHIGGGLLLSVILGPAAGFVTLACVLLIQALFFADGGLLAFGCNLINMGFFTAFIAYPFIFQKITAGGYTKKRLIIGSVIASVIGLQMGAFGVVMETVLSGRTELPFATFLMFMQPIHLAIGLVEGVITGVIISYLYSQNSRLIYGTHNDKKKTSLSGTLGRLVIATIIIGGLLSWYASASPDGLEWSIFNTAGTEVVANTSKVVQLFESVQEAFSPLPDYSMEGQSEQIGTSVSGIVGSLLTMLMAVGIGMIIRFKRKVANSIE